MTDLAGTGRRARRRGCRQQRPPQAHRGRTRVSPSATSGSSPAPRAARSWSSSRASTPRRSLPAGRACGYDRRLVRRPVRRRDPGRLAQSVRARGSHPRGHWFESSIAHHSDPNRCRAFGPCFCYSRGSPTATDRGQQSCATTAECLRRCSGQKHPDDLGSSPRISARRRARCSATKDHSAPCDRYQLAGRSRAGTTAA